MATITFTLEEIIPYLAEILYDPAIKKLRTDGQSIHITVVKSILGSTIDIPVIVSFQQYNDPTLVLNYKVEGKLGGKWVGQILHHFVPNDREGSNFVLESDTVKINLNTFLGLNHVPIRVSKLTQVEHTLQVEFHLVS